MTIQNKAAGYENTDVPNVINLLIEPIPSETEESLKTAPVEDLSNTDWLNERHASDTQLIDDLRSDIKAEQKERYAALERGDEWRDKYLDMECAFNKLKQAHEIEVANLKGEIRQLDQALAIHAKDEQLVFMLAGKISSVGNRLVETVEEGGRTQWI